MADETLDLQWFWLSFVRPPATPKGRSRSLGCVVIPASSPMDAIRASRVLGCNPGGAVAVFFMADADIDKIAVADRMRLMTPKESLRYGRRARRQDRP